MLTRNLLLTIAPALVIVALVFRGPGVRLTAISLALGAAAVFAALWIGLLVPASATAGSLFAAAVLRSFVLVALVEEIARFAAIRVVGTRITAGPRRNGLRCGVITGCGFAITESLLMLGRGTSIIALRAVTALPLHAIAGGIIGFAVGSAGADDDRAPTSPAWATLAGLGSAILIHGSYDLLLSLGSPLDLIPLPILGAGVAAVHLLDRSAARLDDDRERTSGTKA